MVDALTDDTESLFALPHSLLDTDLYKVSKAHMHEESNIFDKADYMRYSLLCSRPYYNISLAHKPPIALPIAMRMYSLVEHAMNAILQPCRVSRVLAKQAQPYRQ